MKRAAQLQPLARQHHLGLNLSRHAKECPDEPDAIAKHWLNITSYINEMQSHFQIETNLIAPALQPYRRDKLEVASVLNTFEAQHKSLEALIAEIQASPKFQSVHVTVGQIKELATLLYDHIRFKERELFPIVERYLTTEQLDVIYDASPDSTKRSDENR